jgi:hypothetical protein
MKKAAKVVSGMFAAALVAAGLTPTAGVLAKSNTGNDYVKDVTDGQETDLTGVFKIIINVILGVVGLIAVVMIIIGGINFTTSQGDPAKTKKARDTVLYGIVGLVVALLAFAIVNFVLTNVFG